MRWNRAFERSIFGRSVLGLCALVLAPVATAQQTFLESGKLLSTQPVPGARLGSSVAVSGDWCAVGAPVEGGPNGQGFVYLFERVGAHWLTRGRLQPASGASSFGWSVAMGGDRLAVGDIGFNNTGRVLVYRRVGATWNQEAEILTSPGGDEDLGSAVALQGNRLAIGGFSRVNPATNDAGHAYVFDWNGAAWVQTTELPAPTGVTADAEFGDAIALDGDRVAVGAHLHSNNRGGVWVYARVGGVWVEEAAVPMPTAQIGAEFGRSLALSGTRLFVGAPTEDSPNQDDGAVHVYDLTGGAWTETAMLHAPTTVLGDRFGTSLAWDSPYLVVGASYDYAVGGPATGSVHVWTPGTSGWSYVQKIFATTPWMFSFFGTSVAIDAGTIVGGLPNESWFTLNNGSARVFTLEVPVGTPQCIGTAAACPCGNAGIAPAGCRNSYQTNGASGGSLLYGYGVTSVAQDSLLLHVVRLPLGATSLLVQGAAGATPTVWGDGLRCVNGSGFVRLGMHTSQAGERVDPEYGQLGLATRGGLPPAGTTVVYQVLYRDTQSYCTPDSFNATNALEVVWSP